MTLKIGPYGKYLECKECGNRKKFIRSTGVKCPKCGEGVIVEKKSKHGKIFYGCNRYPDCSYALWDEPTGNKCPECGYELENGVCPSCGYDSIAEKESEEKQKNMNKEGKKTVRPRRKGEKDGRFVLTPISEETGQPEGDLIQFEGNEVELNRENTDPKNETITSQQQAIVTHENGKWCIEDKSEYKTTFVQASRKIEIQNGDLILLGNQLYQFNSLSEEK